MNDNFSLSQTFRKPAVASSCGIVSAQHRRAAEVGAAVLTKAGDCIDAAIATLFESNNQRQTIKAIKGVGIEFTFSTNSEIRPHQAFQPDASPRQAPRTTLDGMAQ